MKIRMYQVDAFTDKLFGGNPAAVCLLDKWLPDALMQSVAAENNLAETAFLVKNEKGYDIRWFTPTVEVDLCGHATLASAHILFNHSGYTENELQLHSGRSGALMVTRDGPLLTLNFPADTYMLVETPADLAKGLGIQPLQTFKGKTDYMAIFASEAEVLALKPHPHILSTLDCRGIIATAPGTAVDFVSRFFAPQSGIDEDPVTGSAHTTLTPYWSQALKKTELTAIQASKREGHLQCKHLGDRVAISGNAVTYMEAEIMVP